MVKLDKANEGRRVKVVEVSILASRNPFNRAVIGKTGTIRRANKSRGCYDINLDDGGQWSAFPENVEVQP